MNWLTWQRIQAAGIGGGGVLSAAYARPDLWLMIHQHLEMSIVLGIVTLVMVIGLWPAKSNRYDQELDKLLRDIGVLPKQ